MVICQACGDKNRPGAKFCSTCGADLAAASASPRVADEAAASLKPLQAGTILIHPRDGRRRYGIVQTRPLERSVYYDALDLVCPACDTILRQVPDAGLCPHCQAPLDVVLIHGRLASAGHSLPDDAVDRLLHVSASCAGILPHRDILRYQQYVYAVVAHPGRWGVLVRGRQHRSPQEALGMTLDIGQALVDLHAQGFAYVADGGVSPGQAGCVDDVAFESLIMVRDGKAIRLADLSLCVPLPMADAASQGRGQGDVFFLGQMLFCLATGQALSRSNVELAPPALQPLLERVVHAQYADVQHMLADFALPGSGKDAAAVVRPLMASHGQATHPGQRHTRNEDAVVTFTYDKQQDGRSLPVGFYLVADGMGGHEAGDLASRAVNQIVTDRIIKSQVLPDLQTSPARPSAAETPAHILRQALEKANAVLLQRRREMDSDLGSTVTAVFLLGDAATVANVGDSRTYLLRDGALECVTQDHSLVARLVGAGVITSQEARSHPRRNHIYRCLGHSPQIEVDIVDLRLQADDRLLLCSDGLWEMVGDDDIQRLVEQARSPQQACDALVEAANRAGGRDNIAVIVVELE